MDQLKGIQTYTPLSKAFFSNENISGLQTKIRYQVWLKSGKKYVIGNQSNDELLIIMRSIFLQESQNQPNNLLTQIRKLNMNVIDYSVSKILVNVNQYMEYKKSIDGKREIMPHSINMSNRGSKQLTIKPWF